MEFPHPKWIAVGFGLVVIGILMIRWAARNNRQQELVRANAEKTLDAFRKSAGGNSPDARAAAKKREAELDRDRIDTSLSQFIGAIGFILVMAGLTAATLGAFYQQ